MSEWPWPAPSDCGGARHLTPGAEIADLALPSTRGGETSIARLGGLTIVAIYPWTGRPGLPDPPGWDAVPGGHGSTPELAGFGAAHVALRAAGARVVGVSAQDTAHQAELAARLGLPFALLSDRAGLFRRAMALPAFEIAGVAYLKRLTFLCRDGVIERVLYPVHPPDTHAETMLTLLKRRT